MDIEQQVREAFARQGLTVARLGVVEHEQEVRLEVARLERGTAPALTSVGGSLPPSKPAPIEVEARPFSEAEFRCDWCHDAQAVLVTHDRNDPRFGVAVPCTKCLSVDERMTMMGVGPRFVGATLDALEVTDHNRGVIRSAIEWSGQSVVLASRTQHGDSPWGTGKTHIGCALLRSVVERGGMVRFVSVVDMLDGMKAAMDVAGASPQAVTQTLVREPLLMLDDLGAERGTPWAVETIRALLDARYRAQRSTIVTTNLGMAEIADVYGGALASRLREYAWWLVGGPDYRGRKDTA